ncbi:hypothetical protein N7478_000712 [Penicillium angulare]|uniref:uncharacterized protein n=1 Tax=Penicillium angulare TaxID=116970 RepID=UPI0025408000|nr:uncharacterized protein N7478_000712 [Penicillium angulare]KAJ5291461.1 hypothetical protein N7478_000712 [Penicillium angulare]
MAGFHVNIDQAESFYQRIECRHPARIELVQEYAVYCDQVAPRGECGVRNLVREGSGGNSAGDVVDGARFERRGIMEGASDAKQ